MMRRSASICDLALTLTSDLLNRKLAHWLVRLRKMFTPVLIKETKPCNTNRQKNEVGRRTDATATKHQRFDRCDNPNVKSLTGLFVS